jgi:hypothetical protein
VVPDWRPTPGSERLPKPVKKVFIGSAVAGGVVAALLLFLLNDSPPQDASTDGPRVGVIEATRQIEPVLSLAADERSVWFTTPGKSRGRLVQLDPTTLRVVRRLTVGAHPDSVAVGGRIVWVVNTAGDRSRPAAEADRVLGFDLRTGKLSARVHVPGAYRVVAVGNSAWVLSRTQRELFHITVTGVAERVRLAEGQPDDLVATRSGGWVVATLAKPRLSVATEVTRFATGPLRVIRTARVGTQLVRLAATDATVWAIGGGILARFDTRTNRPDRLIRVPGVVNAAAGPSGVWATDRAGMLYRVSQLGNVEGRLRVGEAAAIAVTRRAVWVVVSPGMLLKIRPLSPSHGARAAKRARRLAHASLGEARKGDRIRLLMQGECATPAATPTTAGPRTTEPASIVAFAVIDSSP